MTKKELQAVMKLLSKVKFASVEVKSYCEDFDTTTLRGVAKTLDEAVKDFKKEAKL